MKFTMLKKIKLLLIILGFTLSANTQNIPNVPEWVHSAVFYQIYPQTYYDTDADGIGDIEGIIKKLDYIKGLGVNAIWISPFYESPFMDAGYDVADFYKIAPRYGNMESAKRLFKEAHKRDLKIILDFVVGHTSIEHQWFKESCAENPKYKDWFIWTDGTWTDAGKYSNKMIQGYSGRDGNFMTNFFWCQPKLNYGFPEEEIEFDWQLSQNHPDVLELKKEMKNVLKFWKELGADGFRVDMAGSAGKDFWLDVRKYFDDNYPDAFLISEWGEPATAIEAGFHADFMHWFESYDDLFHKKWFTKGKGHSYFGSSGKGDITHFLRVFFEQYDKIDNKGYISVPVDNHDMVRVRNWGRDYKDLEIIFAFQMTFPTLPFVYYGDEIGMRQLDLEDIPAVEGAYGSRAGNRTPMQWNNDKNYGFSKADKNNLYLPQDSSNDAPTVDKQEDDNSSLLNVTRELINIHTQEKALKAYADINIIYAQKDSYPFIYTRSLDNENILVVLNPSDSQQNVEIGLNTNGKTLKLLSGDGIEILEKEGFHKVNCKGKSYSIYKY